MVQPGVVNVRLQEAAAEHGLFYPPDPASFRECTLGGNLATGAGGLRCVKYGVTRDAVRALEVVLASGEVLRTGSPTAKGVAGYDLTRLMVGSEGTLGVITEATLALQPLPEPALTLAAVFPSAATAMQAAAQIMAGGPRPALLEFLDSTAIRAVQDYRDLGLPRDAGALLLAQSDRGTRAAEDLAAMAAWCTEAGATETAVASDETESGCCSRRGASSTGVWTRWDRPSSRTSASRGLGSPSSSKGCDASPTTTGCSSRAPATSVTATCTRRWSSTAAAPRSSGGRTPPSATSWSSAFGSAAPSPASTASAC